MKGGENRSGMRGFSGAQLVVHDAFRPSMAVGAKVVSSGVAGRVAGGRAGKARGRAEAEAGSKSAAGRDAKRLSVAALRK